MSNEKIFYINLGIENENRFDIERFMEFTDNYDVLTSSILNDLQSIKVGGRYTVEGDDARPDNVSFKIYGDVQYWWIIMLYNSLTDVSQIKNAMELIFPDQDALEEFYFSLQSKQGKS